MKRDFDLVRKILLKLEDTQGDHPFEELTIEGYSSNQIKYHVEIMAQKGLLNLYHLQARYDDETTAYIPKNLTWEGHEFLEAARNENIWKKALKHLQDKGSGLSFEFLKALLIQYGKDLLLPSG